jgi:hypothetical protein
MKTPIHESMDWRKLLPTRASIVLFGALLALILLCRQVLR